MHETLSENTHTQRLNVFYFRHIDERKITFYFKAFPSQRLSVWCLEGPLPNRTFIDVSICKEQLIALIFTLNYALIATFSLL